jgi:multidrug resistance efflux pump
MPAASTRVLAPRAGLVAAVPVKLQQWVDKDQTLFSYDADQTLGVLEVAVARLQKLRHEVANLDPRIPGVRDAKVRLEKAGVEVARAERALDLARGEIGDPFSEQIAILEDNLNWALQELDAASDALDAKASVQQRVALWSLEAEVQELQAQLLETDVKAPRSGALTALAVRPGEPVLTGMDVVGIDDNRKLEAVVTLAPEQRREVAAGQQVLLLSKGRATQATISRTEGSAAHLLIDNTAGVFEPGVAEVQIRAAAQPLLRWR